MRFSNAKAAAAVRVVTASPGTSGAARASAGLADVLTIMGAGPIEILRIGLIKTKVDDERVVDSATIAELAALLDTVLASIESGLDQEA